MNAPEPPPADPRDPRGGRADARAALALGGPILFAPPAIALADRDFSLFGVPALAAYVFAVWFVGIVLTAFLARRGR